MYKISYPDIGDMEPQLSGLLHLSSFCNIDASTWVFFIELLSFKEMNSLCGRQIPLVAGAHDGRRTVRAADSWAGNTQFPLKDLWEPGDFTAC